MPLDKLDKFRTGLPVSKGDLQRWGATRLKRQTIWHHLPEITTTDYSANTNCHTLHPCSLRDISSKGYTLEGWTSVQADL